MLISQVMPLYVWLSAEHLSLQISITLQNGFTLGYMWRLFTDRTTSVSWWKKKRQVLFTKRKGCWACNVTTRTRRRAVY